MDSLMVIHALLLRYWQAVIIEERLFFPFSYKPPFNMVSYHACEEITEWRIFWWLHGWNPFEDFTVDPISGEGKLLLCRQFFEKHVDILLSCRSVHNVRIERL